MPQFNERQNRAKPYAIFEQSNGLLLISGLMDQYARKGDAVEALRWALPLVLDDLNAEAGSLFLHDEEENLLECIVCHGPIDIKGLKIPADKGLVGRTFSTGQPEIVSDVSKDKAHYRISDDEQGFATVSTATAPVHLGNQYYGVIQAINPRPANKRDANNDSIVEFTETDLALLCSLASALAMAIANVQLTEKVVNYQLLQRDLSQATEAQASLMPLIDPNGYASGQVIPARHLSGDFFDYVIAGGKIAFCQGDVAGKGITASLMMARCVTLFRSLVKQGKSGVVIAKTINRELLEAHSDQFVTFVSGWFDPRTGVVELINCGHGPILYMPDNAPDNADNYEIIESHTMPLGLHDLSVENLSPWVGQLDKAALYVMTDGLVEAKHKATGAALGLDGVIALARTHQGLNNADRVTDIMNRFCDAHLTTHDDAALLVVTAIGRLAGILKRFEQSFVGVAASLDHSREFIRLVLSDIGWQDREIDIQLAIGEVMQNTIRHGFEGGTDLGVINITITYYQGQMVCEIADNAARSRPAEWAAIARRRRLDDGGYGLSIIDALSDDYTVIPDDSGNVSQLTFFDAKA